MFPPPPGLSSGVCSVLSYSCIINHLNVFKFTDDTTVVVYQKLWIACLFAGKGCFLNFLLSQKKKTEEASKLKQNLRTVHKTKLSDFLIVSNFSFMVWFYYHSSHCACAFYTLSCWCYSSSAGALVPFISRDFILECITVCFFVFVRPIETNSNRPRWRLESVTQHHSCTFFPNNSFFLSIKK